MATDQAYKGALAAYAQKQAELKQVQTPPQADDFSKETPVIRLEEPLKLKVDEAAWASSGGARHRTLSDRCHGEGQPARGALLGGSFSARVTTTWLVNSEGTIVRKSAGYYQEAISRWARRRPTA
jgi:TldD protein